MYNGIFISDLIMKIDETLALKYLTASWSEEIDRDK